MAGSTGKIAIGIDLGTTNTCVAVYRNEKVETIPNIKSGAFVTPSWVTYTDNEVLIGDVAKDKAIKYPSGSVSVIKRIIGRKYEDPVVQEAKAKWKLNIVQDQSVPKIEVVYKKQPLRVFPEEISGAVLREVKEIAQAYLEEKLISDAVITVPAYFNDHQRQATIDAARIAGLNVLRLVNEPTAASIAYIFDKPQKSQRNVLVYDLGGGTFDVSIVTLEGSNIKVKATRGDTNLGGSNFDERCVEYYLQLIEDKYAIDVAEASETRFLNRLRHQVEKAKHVLSSMVATHIDLPAAYDAIDIDEEFTRARFEDLNDDLFDRTLAIVKQCVREAQLNLQDIDDIVLVGGSTRIPRIGEGLEELFQKPVSKAVNQDHAVAHGAAILAAKLNGTLHRELDILDVTAMSLGIETLGGEMNVLIKRNKQIPTQAKKIFTVGVAGDDAIRIILLEGDDRYAKNNSVLGSFDLLHLPPNPSVEVTFTVDMNGILLVTAVEKSSGINKTANVTVNKGRLSSKQIAMLRRHSNIVKLDNGSMSAFREKKNEFEANLFKLKDNVRKNGYSLDFKGKAQVLRMISETLRWMSTEEGSDLDKVEDRYNEIYTYCTSASQNK